MKSRNEQLLAFPPTLYVAIEELPNDDDFFLAMPGGLDDASTPGQRIALYKLVSEGEVEITTQYKAR